MSNTHEMHVEEVYFHLLERGEKTVELRLNDKKRQKINVGDKIQFICKNRPRVVLLFSVSKIVKSKGFNSLIAEIGIDALGGVSLQQQLVDLRGYYDTEAEERYGAMALFLEG